MNFKTTIVLIILLTGIGGYLYFTREKTATDTTPVVHTLLDVKSADVTAMSITGGDGKQITAQKSTDANGQAVWRLTQPVTAAADTFKVGSLLDEITALKSNNVVPQTGADAPPHTGLDKPQYTISLTCTGGKTVKLSVGEALAIGDAVYVKIDGDDDIDVVSKSLVTTLDKPVSDLRKTQLFDTSSSAVQQLCITHKDGSQLILQKQPKGWQIVAAAAAPTPADQFAVEDLLSAILNMTPVSFVDDPSEAIGLNKPMDTVTFSTIAPSTQPATQPTGTTIKFGGYDDVEKKNVFVALPDGGIVKVAASMLDTLNKKPFELRDKTVLDLDPDQIEAVSIAINQPATTQPIALPSTHSVVFARRKKETHLGPMLPTSKPTTAPATPASTWVVGDKPADDAKITALLAQFHPLKADKFRETTPVVIGKQFVVTFSMIGQAPVMLTLTDPGNDAALVGTYNGLIFEMPRAIAADLSAEFKK